MSSSQALVDPKLTEAATLTIAQVQQLQLGLNALYGDTVNIYRAVYGQNSGADDFFRFR